MSKYKKSHVGKIGFCLDSVLGIRTKKNGNKPQGHYVYIRKVKGRTCDVNVITSLEDRHGKYDYGKLKQVRKGNTYPLPKYDTTLPRWSGVTSKPINGVPLSKVNNIGKNKIKRRHHFFIRKFLK